jgi:hypothetical protein
LLGETEFHGAGCVVEQLAQRNKKKSKYRNMQQNKNQDSHYIGPGFRDIFMGNQRFLRSLEVISKMILVRLWRTADEITSI